MKAHIKDPGKDAVIDYTTNRKTRRALAQVERKTQTALKKIKELKGVE